MVVVNRATNPQVFLVPPSQLAVNSGTTVNTAPNAYQTDNISLSNPNVIPNNYPQVSNNVPTNIFNQQPVNTQVPQNNQPPAVQNGQTAPANTGLKPVSMGEAQWAVKFEEKVLKKGYQPPADEMAKYQDIVARFKANPKVEAGILEMLSAQSSALGAQIAAMRNAPAMADHFRALRGGVPATPPAGDIGAIEKGLSRGTLSGLGGIGKTALKSGGLGGLVSGGFSLVTNGIQALQGKKSWSDVGGSVAADAANGTVSGITATLAGGGATLIAGALGATGIVSTLIVGLGAVGGAFLGDKLFRGTGAYDWVKEKVEGLFSKKTAAAPTQNTATQFQATQYAGAQVYKP